MSKYPQFEQLNLPQITEEMLAFWKQNDIFQKSVDTKEGAEPYVFFEGPPSANGMPGIHHVMARTIKDIFCRYKTLKGFQVKRKAGWDTHGLPVELGVEKELGITKEDIGTKITVEEYNEACRKAVMKYTDVWNDLTEKMGYWVDMENPYVTYENKYIESVWWLLKQLFDKNLLYKGYTIQPYSPAAGTGLSSHELNQPGCYQDVKDQTVVAQFKAKDQAATAKAFGLSEVAAPIYFLAWTTTPWTLPSNTALAVGKNIDYSIVQSFNQYTHEPIVVVLASNLLNKHFSPKNAELKIEDYQAGDKKVPFKVLGEVKGENLVGLKYEQLLPYALPAENPENAFCVISGDFVTTEDGTGVVHIAPTFGADDMRVAKDAGVPAMLVKDANGDLKPLVDLQGRFLKQIQDDLIPISGQPVKEAYLSESEKAEALKVQQEALKEIVAKLDKYLSVDELIALKLKLENKAFKIERYEHSYPHCWRTDKPVLYYPLDSWFVRTTEKKDKLIELNKSIKWKPESTGTGRFGNWLENLQDWNLSRSRFWGIPLPVWVSVDKSEVKCIGSIEELKAEIDKSVAKGLMEANPLASFEPNNFDEKNYKSFDLHRPYADDIVLVSDSGQAMQREKDLIDVWFDSGAMPYAQLHYPFENKELIDNNKSFPADFIAEGVDQTRGWFFTLHAIATMCFDSVAYKNVVSNGLVLDKNGQKMSKRLGNATDPFETIEKYGSDATRWYMVSNAQPWDNLKFDVDGISEVQRKFFRALYSTYSFFALYANVDKFQFDAEELVPYQEREELDRWILSVLQNLTEEVDASYNDYDPTKATRAVQSFVVDQLSNWYIRQSRRRFWKGEMSKDKVAAYQTLFECLLAVAKLMSPVSPFFGEWLYNNLKKGSVETCKWTAEESVHLSDFPVADKTQVDEDLVASMDIAQNVSSMVLSLRKKADIRVRQPLQKVIVPITSELFKARLEKVEELVKAETNVKEIEFATDGNNMFSKTVKPNFKTLGPKYGKQMKAIAAAFNTFTNEQIQALESGSLKLELGGEEIVLAAEDAEVHTQDVPGYQMMANKGVSVALDITLNDTLVDEGLARELINRVQNVRKESGLDVTDRVLVDLKASATLQKAVENNKSYICTEILADNISFQNSLEAERAVAVEIEEGVETLIQLQKIN